MDKRGGGGYHDFPSKFLSHCTEIFHWRTLWCFRKILLSKIFMHMRGGILVLSKFFVSQDRTKSFVKEPFCFPEVCWYRKKFMDKRGHITIFYRKFVVSVPKNFVGEPFSVPEKFWYRKMLGTREGGEYHNFPSKFFCLTVPKNFVGESFSVSLISGIENFYASEGYVTIFDFLWKFFFSQCRKIL